MSDTSKRPPPAQPGRLAPCVPAVREALGERAAQAWLERLAAGAEARIDRHGRSGAWRAALYAVPALSASTVAFGPVVRCGRAADASPQARAALAAAIRALVPWRKGPFELFGHAIDAEWRSDLKWDRVAAHAAPFAGRRVLDVGCGNGYYAWRAQAAGARCVVGLDPTVPSVLQFRLVSHCAGEHAVLVTPGIDEDIDAGLAAFDTVMSLGVLYHRRDPRAHLARLRHALRPGGECLLETLVVEGSVSLEPAGRYAGMPNVHVVPSRAQVLDWLDGAGFGGSRCVDVSRTTPGEQRVTAYSTGRSLADVLDPSDARRTIEGHPAPLRALFVASAV